MVEIEGYKFIPSLLKTETWGLDPVQERISHGGGRSPALRACWQLEPLPHSQLFSLLLCKSPRDHGRIHQGLLFPTPARPPVQSHPWADSTYLKVFRDRSTSEFEQEWMNWGTPKYGQLLFWGDNKLLHVRTRRGSWYFSSKNSRDSSF